MADNVRAIESAPSTRAAARDAHHRDRERDAAEETTARRVADELKTRGSVILTGEDEARSRRIGRRAGKLINRKVRTKRVNGGIAVWDDERGSNPLHAHLDEQRTNRLLDQFYKEHGPITGPR
ncbi:hypothetical protein [Thermobifida cellulosilytica]|uniref:Uncharacterized protein n=1 Tax=Thermobifida cellulosilytica TB100 TaxID=665004 RepID=A0A147KEZ7_THECS|nr:hypothetical protein [Thermobifida cellulosilytica]KUP95863.1 hypothetical protein AC529_15325 [Thermobifida cellulosilytica TB100]